MASVAGQSPRAANRIELSIGGMTCASCATRIEKKLNRMDGVTATVNYAPEKASVAFADPVTPRDLMATVAKTGYTAQLPPRPRAAAAPGEAIDGLSGLRTRLRVSLLL